MRFLRIRDLRTAGYATNSKNYPATNNEIELRRASKFFAGGVTPIRVFPNSGDARPMADLRQGRRSEQNRHRSELDDRPPPCMRARPTPGGSTQRHRRDRRPAEGGATSPSEQGHQHLDVTAVSLGFATARSAAMRSRPHAMLWPRDGVVLRRGDPAEIEATVNERRSRVSSRDALLDRHDRLPCRRVPGRYSEGIYQLGHPACRRQSGRCKIIKNLM